MDYDDSDFQSHTFQLAGEENNSFPLGLRSYPLPKFDLDDNLQVNLRFDSLVESEALLGIQGQEQNQWIEDFSGGSSGLEFNSSAAESCSISRRNNVWSEATSSESVEMLLKSVGQDEMIMEQTIIEEPGACDGLGNLGNEMELKSSQDGFVPSSIGDTGDVKSTPPTDEGLETLPDLSADAANQLPMVRVTPQIEGGKSGNESSRDLDPVSADQDCNLEMIKGNILIEEREYEANKEEGPFDLLGGRTLQDYSDAIKTSLQAFATNDGELNNQQKQAENLRQLSTQVVGERQSLTEESHMEVQNCEGNQVETSENNVAFPLGIAVKVGSTQVQEVSRKGVFPDNSVISKCQEVVSCTDTQSVGQNVGKTQEVSFSMGEKDNSSSSPSVVVAPSTGGISSSPLLVVNPLVQIIQGGGNTKSAEKQEDSLEDDGIEYPLQKITQGHITVGSTEKQMDLSEDAGLRLASGNYVNNDESIAVSEGLVVKGQCAVINTVDTSKGAVINTVDTSNLVVELSPSTSIIHVSQEMESVKNGDDLRVHGDGLDVEAHISSSMHVENSDRNSMGFESSAVHSSHSDVSILEKDDPGQPNVPSTGEGETDGSLSLGKLGNDKLIIHGDELGAEAHISSSMDVENSDRNSVGVELIDVHSSHSDVSILEKDDPDQPNAPSTGESEAGGSLSLRKNGNDDLIVLEASFCAEAPMTCSMQKLDRVLVGSDSSDVHFSQSDVSEHYKEDIGQCNEPGKGEYETDGFLAMGMKASSSYLSPATNSTDLMDHETTCNQNPVEESVSTGGLQNVCELSCNDKSDGADKLPSRSSIIVDEAIEEHKDAKGSPRHVEELAIADTVDETLIGSSEERSSIVVKMNSQINYSVPATEIEQSSICGSSPELLDKNADQSSSSLVDASMTCHNEPQTITVNIADRKRSIEEDCPVAHDSLKKENDDAEVVGIPSERHKRANVKIAGSHGEASKQSIPPSLDESSCDISLQSLDVKEAGKSDGVQNLVAGADGDAINGCKESLIPATMSRDDSVSQSLETAISFPKSTEANCGSHTPIGFNELSQSEKENQDIGKRSMGEYALASDDINLGVKGINSAAHNSNENSTSKDDRSFTFEANSRADIAQGKPHHEWKAFPSIQPNESPQGLPSTTSGLGQISRGSPLKSGGKNTHRSAKGNTAEKTTPVSGKSSARKTYNKGKLLKDEVPQSEKEPQKGERSCLNPSTPVCHGIMQKPNVVSSISSGPKEKHGTLSDRSLAFEGCPLEPLSASETCNGWKTIPSTQPCVYTQTVGASPLGISQIDPKILQEMSRGSARASVVKSARRSSKGTAEDKARLLSGKAVDRETAKEGKHLKELAPIKQSKERRSNLFSASPSPVGVVSRVLQADELRPFGFTEGSSAKPCAGPIVQASNLPDLNASASQSTLFWQPFTDFQQVQLRAQIFVYGSLIQGTAPDEACMVSAFGESDRGKSTWENVWRIAVERLQNQKSPLNNPETPVTPLHLHSGAKISEPGAKQILHQSEVVSTPSRAGNKSGPPAAVMNPVIPLSSPVWSISTPREGFYSSSMMRGPQPDSHQTLFPLHPYQSPQLRHYIGPTSPWQSQAPSPATWVVTPQTAAVERNAHFPVLPVSDTVHISSVRESPVPRTSVMQPVPPSPVIYTGGSTIISTGTSIPMDTKSTTAPSGKYVSSDVKSRKRKKSVASVELGQISFVHPQEEPVSSTSHYPPASVAASVTPISSACKVGQISFSHPQEEPASAINHHPSTSVAAAVTPVSTVSRTGTAVLPTSPLSSTHHQIIGGEDRDQRILFSEEACSKIEQAKQQAEDAAALAASAVKHSQSIWSQLAIQKNSGLVSDIEAKLASSAVAIAAAASVAKAAAAAAKVAFDAAMQAKMMADEALGSNKPGISASEASLHDGVWTIGKVTPASILKGKDRTDTSGSVLVAAKVGAKKRVEAASAATRRAENLDAVVKAAELAAEAVSQAGAIVAMGDPIPLTLSELVVAGPEGHWKVQTIASEPLVKSKTTNLEKTDLICVEEGLDLSAKHFTAHPAIETTSTNRGNVLSPKEIVRQSSEKMWVVNERWGSFTSNEKGLEGKRFGPTSDVAKTIGIVPESQIGPIDASFGVQNEDYEQNPTSKASEENKIEEGSAVEVLSCEESLRRVWSPAKVLSLKDGKAFVCYSEHAREEGSGPSKDWVPLEGEDGKCPRIRIPHPASTFKHDGTRKRRREARGDYVWSVGDKVDAWMDNSWWEGVITEKGKEDETNMTVLFSDGGDRLVVRSWNLRPSLFWKDGKWVECFSLKGKYCSYPEGDTRQEKRPKLVTSGVETDSAIEVRGKDNMSKHMGTEETTGKLDASLPLALSEKERVFTMGKNSNSDARGTKRTGLQKEGSRGIFGVPKPEKKRKFMDVSKHYVATKSGKASEGNDSIKFARFLIPQESAAASRGGWKNPSKVVPKGKRAADSRPKVLKTGKTQSSLGKNSFDKDCSSTSILSASVEGTMQDHLQIVEASATLGRTIPEKQKLLDHGSFPNSRKATESQVLSSPDLVSEAPNTKKKPSSVMTNLGNKGKVAPSGEKLIKNEEKDAGHNPGKSMPDSVEPRRSNRRIQPTSRLLEGLQSSLTISKIPSVAHDKGQKAQQRGAASRGV